MSTTATATQVHASSIARDVAAGLSTPHKRLPPYLFYDATGSALYEQITELPEYYPTRTERAILARHAHELVERAAEGSTSPLRVVELGAGTATKTSLVLDAVVARQGACVYIPIDVSASALAEARTNIEARLPRVSVRPFVGDYTDALPTIADLGPRRLVLFIGSSVGNFEDAEAVALLAGVRRSLAPGGALLLGSDLRKNPERLLPAYDDAAGVTAAFNLNLLTRINREFGGTFDVATFRHVAVWNDSASRIEMHLESQVQQQVEIAGLGLTINFAAGERIHTESSIKYDMERIDRLLGAAGFARETSYLDNDALFAVHLARAVPLPLQPGHGRGGGATNRGNSTCAIMSSNGAKS